MGLVNVVLISRGKFLWKRSWKMFRKHLKSLMSCHNTRLNLSPPFKLPTRHFHFNLKTSNSSSVYAIEENSSPSQIFKFFHHCASLFSFIFICDSKNRNLRVLGSADLAPRFFADRIFLSFSAEFFPTFTLCNNNISVCFVPCSFSSYVA